jgi:ATP-dependent exoDNAse (exonuclease V) beta subunit
MSTVVEASAGTGKTTALVNAIVDAIAQGTRVDTIVAVTFTHAAAGNMKLRVRHELEQRDDPNGRLAEAARSLDRAFIGTIHAFCAQLLRRRPVEAGVDPAFTELAQPDALRVFASVFQSWIESRLSQPLSPALTRAFARLAWREDRDGAPPIDALRNAAWNLAEWRDFDEPWDKRAFPRDAELATLIGQAEVVADLRARSGRRYRDGFQPVADFAARARKLHPDAAETELLRLPAELRWAKPQGKQDPVFVAWENLKAAIEIFAGQADADLAGRLRDELWEVVGLYQERKRRAGQLDFMDLLLHARILLRNDAARANLQSVYTKIFVDEFQDTDPLQAEILLLLAAADPTEANWRAAVPATGKLYVVGDPKQSIYRFRRADAKLFRSICAGLQESGAESGKLTTSTRSRKAIQSFVNAAFEGAIPDYLPLDGGVEGPGLQPAVVALPMPRPYGTRNVSNVKIEECSPGAVAAYIDWLCNHSGWKVRDRSTGAWLPIRPEHVCILFRRFTNFGVDLTQEYVRALEARGIAHLLVGSKSFHRREEVGTLRAALHAVEWPDDELSVFAVLRGSLCAITDDTLLRFKNAYGAFRPMRPLPDDLDPEFHPIRDAFALLRDLHRRRNYRPIADTIRALLEATRAHAGFAFRKGGERVLANVYRLTDLARSFELSGAATSFRAFVEYLDAEAEGSDTGEAPILEQEGGGVQLMTVHKAKGLEFPVVILADLTAKLTGPQGGDRFTDPDRRLCAQRLLWCAPWELRDAEAAEAEADRDEALRIAYVAATRARDLLVVAAIGEEEREGGWLSPLYDALYPPKDRWRQPDVAPGCPHFGHRTVLNRPPDQHDEVSIKPGLHYSKADQPIVWFDPEILTLDIDKHEGVENEQLLNGTTDQAVEGLRLYNEWKSGRAARIESASAPRHNVKTAERMPTPAEAKDLEVETITLTPAAGRPAGRNFGRLVHDILERAARPEDVASLASVWGRRHGVPEPDWDYAAAAARAALDRLASLLPAGAKLLREVPFLVRLDDGTLVDGRIDFAWSDGQRWTVVDYKTGRDSRPSQVRTYALAIKKATGLPARGIILQV